MTRRYNIALEERDVQVTSFKDINATLRKDLQLEWTQMIGDWEKNHSKPNPYAPTITKGKPRFFESPARSDCSHLVSLTEAQVRLDLRKDELADKTTDHPAQQAISVAAFLIMGLELEDSQ